MMLKSNEDLIAELKAVLAGQRYHPRTISNYCGCARRFLDYLERREIQVENVTEAQVSTYMSRARGYCANAMVDQGHTSPRSRAPESMLCCSLRRASGHPSESSLRRRGRAICDLRRIRGLAS